MKVWYESSLSFALGIISLICWGVAESPQIIFNFRTKSSHGAHLTPLEIWIAADIFNLVACLLEPATVPTQFYTAVLFTTSTSILILQSLYYQHIRKWLKPDASVGPEVQMNSLSPTTMWLNVLRAFPPRQDYYYMSARSFAEGKSPPDRAYILRTRRFGPSPVDMSPVVEIQQQTAAPLHRPLSPSDGSGSHGAQLGKYLAWLMASLYVSSRFPVRTLKGLDPLIFMFALIANATYIGSILAKSTEKKMVIANMPWLIEAVVCVAIDAFILIEYIYYRYFNKEIPNS